MASFLSFVYFSSCYSESSIVLAAETLPYVASLEKQCLMLSGIDMFIFLRTRRIQQQKGEPIEWRLQACRNLRRYVKKREEMPTLFPRSSCRLPVDAIYCRESIEITVSSSGPAPLVCHDVRHLFFYTAVEVQKAWHFAAAMSTEKEKER